MSNEISKFVKFYAITSNINSEKVLLLLKEVVLKVICCYLLTFTINKLYQFISYTYLATF